jgi:hypothetical protein
VSGRGLSVAFVAQLDALQNKISHLCEAYFDDESVYATDLYTPVDWNGHTYLAVGHFLGFDGIEESTDSIIPQATIKLSGVQQDWISRVMSKKYRNRRLVVRKAACNASWQVVIDPGVLFDGFMKRPRIVENPDQGTCTVVLECSHDAADFDNASGRRTNDEMHRVDFPTDKFFQYASQADRQLIWGEGGGGSAPAAPTYTPSTQDDYYR